MTLITATQNGIQSPAPSRSATTKNGNLWEVLQGANGAEFWVLVEGTWVRDSGRFPAIGAFRTDEDDNAHYTYVSGSRLYYVRGIPNAARTSWTWETPISVRSASGLKNPDLVVHREGTGWVIHIIHEHHTSYTSSTIEYEWRMLSTETLDAGLPGDPSYLYSHDHFLYRWSTSNTQGPWPSVETWQHSHTLGSPNPGPRTHTHSAGNIGSGTLTGKTRTTYGGTYYNSIVDYVRVVLDSSGASTIEPVESVSPQYTDNRSKYPTIAFGHAGDEKTVGASPDLFVAWSTGRAGVAYGIRAKKATYAAGDWTWEAERAVDPGYVANTDQWLNVVFDGTAAIVGGLWRRGSNEQLVLREWDVADTDAVSIHESAAFPLSGAGRKFLRGAITYDGDRNIYVVGADDASPLVNATVPSYSVWDRATTTMGAAVPLSSAASNKTIGQVTVKRGFSHSAIDIFYGLASSPYSVIHERIELVDKPLKTKTAGAFLAGEITHRQAGIFERGTIRRKLAGAFQ